MSCFFFRFIGFAFPAFYRYGYMNPAYFSKFSSLLAFSLRWAAPPSFDRLRNLDLKDKTKNAKNVVFATRQRLRDDRICRSHSDLNTIVIKRKLEIYGLFMSVFSER